jgi:hypothetical protein
VGSVWSLWSVWRRMESVWTAEWATEWAAEWEAVGSGEESGWGSGACSPHTTAAAARSKARDRNELVIVYILRQLFNSDF